MTLKIDGEEIDIDQFPRLHDSGEREHFATGANRDVRHGKGRFDLISPIALARLAQLYEKGGKKYADRNWEQGIPLCRSLDSALRHINQFLEGRRDEDHLVAAVWNLFAVIHTEEMIRRGHLPPELNDLPDYFSTQG
jgi:hypothetical protein